MPENTKDWKVSGTEQYAIRGIPDDLEGFNGLNKTFVYAIPKKYAIQQRIVDKVTRGFKVDEEGKFLHKDITISSGSIAIYTIKKLAVPYVYFEKQIDGYGFIDTIHDNETNKDMYMYILPKTVVYQTNQTALALSVKSMKGYKGMGYVTWDSGTIFLHIIPYKPRLEYMGTKILKTGCTLNYDKEVRDIVIFWIQNRFIPDISLTSVEHNEHNLALKPPSVWYDEYIPVEQLALGDKEVFGGSERK